MFQNADEVKKYIADEDVKFVDVRFCDLPGVMQHFTVPVAAFDRGRGARLRRLLDPRLPGHPRVRHGAPRRPVHRAVDPFRRDKTLNINFFIHDPITGEQYCRDPRNVAKKAEAYLASTGIADTAYFGPEAEFYVFDSVRFETSANEGFYHIDSEAGAWNTGSRTRNNRGYKVRYKGGYFPVPPVDHFADLRAEISLELDKSGLQVERQHHEVGTAGQAEINYKFNTLLAAADDLHALQVHREERRLAQRQDRDLHAEADLRRQRLGHARPPVAVERRRARCSTTSRATRACRTSPATTSAASSSTPRRCWPSPTRR